MKPHSTNSIVPVFLAALILAGCDGGGGGGDDAGDAGETPQDPVFEDATLPDAGDPTAEDPAPHDTIEDIEELELGQDNCGILSMAAGTWAEIPDSSYEGVCACTHGFDEVCGVEYCAGVLSYSGGTYDAMRNRLILWGGGHDAYYGNELYAFSFETCRWDRITDPSPPTSRDVCADPLPDGNPNSRHTYDGLAYIAHADRLFAIGGSLACGAGNGTNLTWTFDFAAGTWQNMNPEKTNFPEDEPGVSAYNYACAYDPVTGNVYLEATEGFYVYDYDENTWTKLEDIYYYGGRWGSRTGVIDPERRLFISVGSDLVWVYDLEDPVLQEWTTTGDQAMVSAGAPGMAYDPVHRDIVAWHNGEVFRFDPETREWTPTGASWTPSRTYGDLGYVFGRFDYIPAYDAFFAYVDIGENVHVFKNHP